MAKACYMLPTELNVVGCISEAVETIAILEEFDGVLHVTAVQDHVMNIMLCTFR